MCLDFYLVLFLWFNYFAIYLCFVALAYLILICAVLVETFSYSFSQIAIDWQVHAADQRFYDILFIGTGNRRCSHPFFSQCNCPADCQIALSVA